MAKELKKAFQREINLGSQIMPAHPGLVVNKKVARSRAHPPSLRPDLPIIEEEHDIATADKFCPICTKPYKLLSRTEDSDIV